MEVTDGRKIYFLSDFHLGAPDYESSLQREKKIVSFLHEIKATAHTIFIVGDMFDFWFEYKHVTPKGYVRLLGKLAELTDSGIKIYFFAGNHDMWMSGYFEKELNIPVYHEPSTFVYNNKKFLVAHGDGLGPGDHGYKMLKRVFRNKLCQSMFGFLHPWAGIGLANYFSRSSRKKTGNADDIFLGEEKEWLIIFAKEELRRQHINYFVFGHRHLPLQLKLAEHSYYVNLGDWIKHFSYAVFDGHEVTLQFYQHP